MDIGERELWQPAMVFYCMLCMTGVLRLLGNTVKYHLRKRNKWRTKLWDVSYVGLIVHREWLHAVNRAPTYPSKQHWRHFRELKTVKMQIIVGRAKLWTVPFEPCADASTMGNVSRSETIDEIKSKRLSLIFWNIFPENRVKNDGISIPAAHRSQITTERRWPLY